MKIIIQSGGIGTRMKELARCKPKSLISAKYMPLIFHLFKKYLKDEFIIIGDYKFDILDRYLATFAKDINYILLKSKEKGNAAGIKDAVSLIPDNEPFMIIWSDIILADKFTITEIHEGCQVGIVDFPCSWSLINGKLEQIEKLGNGVAGLYVFNNKSWFTDFPIKGSFTKWLQAKEIPLFPISLMGSIDIGTIEAYQEINSTTNRCRPYNRIDFIDGKVEKTALTPEGQVLIEREIIWYNKMTSYNFDAIPKIYNTDPLTLEYINGTNVFLSKLDNEQKKKTLDKIIAALKQMHSYETAPASCWDIYAEYLKKTIHRLQTIQYSIPFANDKIIKINGHTCVNILRHPHLLRQAVLDTLMNIKSYVPIHGDCQLTNTMIDKEGKIYFIDARGYFGKSKVLGDPRYDWAKVYYALSGNFDQFNIKNFELLIDDSVNFKIDSGNWEFLTEHFLNSIPKSEANPKELTLIHAIIWLSLSSHAWEDFDSMCIAFYNGVLLFNQWMEAYGKQYLNTFVTTKNLDF